MFPIIKLLRPHQYIKNFFIFAPLFFSFNFNLAIVGVTSIGFVLFSILASSIYVLNDWFDVEEDRKHPTKRNRPLASGEVSKSTALILMILLSSLSLIFAYLLNHDLFYVLAIYFVLNVLYSFKLKHVAIIDIFIISTGFVLRLFAGAVFLENPLSMWIIIMTFLLATFLAFAKRRDDVLLFQEGQQARKNIDGYNLEFVNAAMTLMSAVIIVCYLQYSITPEVIERMGTDYLYVTAVFVILGILRYMQIAFVENKSGSPTQVVLQDRFLQLTIICWILSFILIYFVGKGHG